MNKATNKQAKAPLKFSGIDRDSLFKSYDKWNPFEDKLKEIDASPRYHEIVKKWDAKANDNLVKDALTLGTRVATIAGGVYVKAHGVPTDPVDQYADAIAVGVSGFLAEKSIKPVYKLLTKPEIQEIKESLQYRSDDIKYSSGDVGLACNEIRKRVIGSHPLFLWPRRETRVSELLKGFISDYGAEQYWVKKLLPEIKGHPDTNKYVVSLIEKYYNECKDNDYSNRVAYSIDDDEDFPDAGKIYCCITNNDNVYERALDSYGASVRSDRKLLDPTIKDPEKIAKAAKHLKEKTPAIISYLRGN